MLPSSNVSRYIVTLATLCAGLLILAGCSTTTSETPEPPKDPCDTAASVSTDNLRPGDLVAAADITNMQDANFPTNARAWRVLYASTGRDNTDVQLICGVVVAPNSAAAIQSASPAANQGRMVTWSHGTIALVSRCQPSMTPEKNIWGQMPGGINLVAWGNDSKSTGKLGSADAGALQYMINQGWVVAATDYFADLTGGDKLEPYIVGKAEGAQTIDSARAAHRLLTSEYSDLGISSYEYLTYGHSQGGHSAMWAAQLAEPYLQATRSEGDPDLQLRGTALLAPATTLVVEPDKQPYTAPHFGLGDWISGQKMGPTLFGQEVGVVPLGPTLYSYILGAWQQMSTEGSPDPSQMPAFPPTATNLDFDAIATSSAQDAIGKVTDLCLERQPTEVLEHTAQFIEEPFLLPALQDGPVIEGQRHGNMDLTCATNPEGGLGQWCDWLRYQLPGPLGSSELPKLPRNGDQLAPVYIADATNDLIVRCAASMTVNEQEDVIPTSEYCLSRAFYDALAQEAYCPTGQPAAGYLQMDLWQQNPTTTTAGHFDVPGLASARNLNDPSFVGSPLQQFMDQAFNQKLAPLCVGPTLMNPSDNVAGIR